MNYNKLRRKVKKVYAGNVAIGGDAPIAVQSMTNTDPHDLAATLSQVRALRLAGCDLVRLTVPDREAATVFGKVKEAEPDFPLVADIHFDYRLALAAVEAGADKIRINPGNIGGRENVRAVCRACAAKGIPIRVGVNGGSLQPAIRARYGAPVPGALVESAMEHIALLEAENFTDIVVSLKTSTVESMIAANRELAAKIPYPIHLGVTEAGGGEAARLKSAIGIGALLCDGIGDTIRVSLTDDPVAEVTAARDILTALAVDGQCGMDIISCPTCGRTKIDLIDLAARFRAAAEKEGLLSLPLRVALMGCPVNGPGEAAEADIGICGGKGEALLIRKGQIIRKLPEEDVISCLIAEIRKIKEKE